MFVEDKKAGEQQTELEPWRQLLLAGADYIETHGHTKNRLWESSGAVCFRGALSMACGWDMLTQAENKVAEYLGLHVGAIPTVLNGYVTKKGSPVVVDWNNAPERTGEEVIAAMRGAARRGI